MLKLRLGLVLGTVALLAGCPEPVDDFRQAYSEARSTAAQAQYVAEEYACPNLRLWREELDLPAWLADSSHDKDDETRLGPGDIIGARRERLKKEYIHDHQGTYVVCRTRLEVTEKPTAESAGRGTCPTCTDDLKNPKYKVQQVNVGVDKKDFAVELLERTEGANTCQILWKDKIEYRLKPIKSDYLTDQKEQEESFRQWLKKRGGVEDGSRSKPEDPPHIEDYVARERGKGAFSREGQTPKSIPKYDLPPLAEPLIRCPNPECKWGASGKPAVVSCADNRCWNCNQYYTIQASDERLSIAEPHELFCPICKKETVDPTLNYCNKCGYHKAIASEQPCWRCGGSHICPECGGSGRGGGPIMGGDTCYICGKPDGGPGDGKCPECGKGTNVAGNPGSPAQVSVTQPSNGFTIEDGALPPSFNPFKRNRKEDWKLTGAKAASAPSTPKSDETPKKDEAPK